MQSEFIVQTVIQISLTLSSSLSSESSKNLFCLFFLLLELTDHSSIFRAFATALHSARIAGHFPFKFWRSRIRPSIFFTSISIVALCACKTLLRSSIIFNALNQIEDIRTHLKDDMYLMNPLTSAIAWTVTLNSSRDSKAVFKPGKLAANGRTLWILADQRVLEKG